MRIVLASSVAILALPVSAFGHLPPANGDAPVRVNPIVNVQPLNGSGSVALGGGPCTNLSTHSDANFQGDEFNLQAGFAEGEIAAAQYVVPPAAFPIKIETMDIVFGTQNANRQTATEWTVFVWDGPPNTGELVAQFSSDGVILQPILVGPGTAGALLSVQVDPGDPEQIFILNNSGTNSFTVGFRIDDHHAGPANPCGSIPSNANAFPVTDVTGVSQPNRNWLFAINCPLACPAGWHTFGSYPFFCQPTGDWVIRAAWSSVNCQQDIGACCLTDGSCVSVTAADCQFLAGQFQGVGATCGQVECPEATEACCFEQGGCLDLSLSDCGVFGGFPQGPGTNCTSTPCFPEGACCLQDGSCVDGVSPDECEALNGIFQGDRSTCALANCPDPVGACCAANGACLVLTQAQCNQVPGAQWQGGGTTCADGDGSGQADACEQGSCPADLNGDGQINLADLGQVLASYGMNAGGDIDGDGDTDLGDLGSMLSLFGTSCP